MLDEERAWHRKHTRDICENAQVWRTWLFCGSKRRVESDGALVVRQLGGLGIHEFYMHLFSGEGKSGVKHWQHTLDLGCELVLCSKRCAILFFFSMLDEERTWHRKHTLDICKNAQVWRTCQYSGSKRRVESDGALVVRQLGGRVKTGLGDPWVLHALIFGGTGRGVFFFLFFSFFFFFFFSFFFLFLFFFFPFFCPFFLFFFFFFLFFFSFFFLLWAPRPLLSYQLRPTYCCLLPTSSCGHSEKTLKRDLLPPASPLVLPLWVTR